MSCHLQHVSCFARHLQALAQPANGTKGKRQLDCAGVVSTVLAICQAMAMQHGREELADLRFQVTWHALLGTDSAYTAGHNQSHCAHILQCIKTIEKLKSSKNHALCAETRGMLSRFQLASRGADSQGLEALHACT